MSNDSLTITADLFYPVPNLCYRVIKLPYLTFGNEKHSMNAKLSLHHIFDRDSNLLVLFNCKLPIFGYIEKFVQKSKSKRDWNLPKLIGSY